MKLRIRSLESKETVRIEVPNACTVTQLKELVIGQLSSSSSSSSSPPGNLVLSLNRKDEFYGSDETLRSLGIITGDLIYHSINPFAFASSSQSLPNDFMNVSNEKPVKTDAGGNGNLGSVDIEPLGSVNMASVIDDGKDAREREALELSRQSGEPVGKILGSSTHKVEQRDLRFLPLKETRESIPDYGNRMESEESKIEESFDGTEDMEIDELVLAEKAKFSVPSFLRKMIGKEVGGAANGGDHKLLAMAVHAVLLESGFVAFDPVSGMTAPGFHHPNVWPSLAFTLSLSYTLPEIVSTEAVDTVTLKLQTLGKFVNVYGSLPERGFGVCRVSLDESRILPALDFIWKNGIEGGGSLPKSYPEGQVFEFWRIMKDRIALPLLIDLCEKAGLILPPCFMRLPTELKLKILESVPAVDVAKVACVCTELRFLSSNNDLWKLKYTEEFGVPAGAEIEVQWKARFGIAVENRKKRKKACNIWRGPAALGPRHFPFARSPNFFGPAPFIIGGDYDRIPHFGMRQLGPQRFSSLSPGCNFGGFHH